MAFAAAAGTRSATSMGMGFNVHAPSNVAVSGFYDAIVPGFDWTYDHYSSADTKLSRAANGTVGGAPLSGTASRVVTAANIAKVGVKLAKLAGPVSLGLTLSELIWDELSQQWKKPEELETPQDGYYWFSSNNLGVCPQTGTCSFTQAATAQCSGSSGLAGSVFVQIKTLGSNYADIYCSRPPNTGMTQAFQMTVNRTNTQRVLETVPATDADIEDAIYVELVARGMSSDLARRLVEAGYAPDLLPGSGPSITSGPSSLTGPSSTSTTQTAAGPVTTVTNTTYNVTYNNQTVNVTETTTTTKTNPDNSTETTTETKTPAPTEGAEEVPPEEPPETDCEKFPDASGCKPLDDVADEDLQQETENVTWSAEGGAAGSCPAPMNWNTQFGTYAIEWTPVCEFASGIRPFVVGIAWLAAGLFIFAVAKEKA